MIDSPRTEVRESSRMGACQMEVSSPGIGRARVLIVEDEAGTRRSIRNAFQLRGFVVNTTEDGGTGLTLALHDDYDVVVTDVRVPGLSGIDLTRKIRVERPACRVIVLTALPEWEVCLDASRAGASCVLTKPLDLARLIQTVERLAARAPDAAPETGEGGEYGGEG